MYSIVIASALLLIWWLWQGSLPLPMERFEAIFSLSRTDQISPGRDFLFNTILQNNLIVWSALAGLSVLILAIALLIFFGLRDYFARKNKYKKGRRPPEITYLNQMGVSDEVAALQLMVQETEIRDTDNQIDITPREFTPISIFGSEDDYASQELLIDELSVSSNVPEIPAEDSVLINPIDVRSLPQVEIGELVTTGRLIATRLRQDNEGDRGNK